MENKLDPALKTVVKKLDTFVNEFPVKMGDKFVVGVACWQNPDWYESQPCIVFMPILRYDYVKTAEELLEHTLVDAIVHDEMISDDMNDVNDYLEFAGTSWKVLKKKIQKALDTGIPMFKNKHSKIILQEVEIVALSEKNRELKDWKVLSEIIIQNEVK